MIKLIYIFRYISKDEVIDYFHKLINDCIQHGKIEGLIITGNTNFTINILSKYIDKTNDLLVTYILSKFFLDHKEIFFKTCENDLFDSLNKMKMFNQRIILNHKLNEIYAHISGKIGNSGQPIYKKYSHNEILEFVINCFYCNVKIQPDKADQFRTLFINNKEPNELVNYFLFFYYFRLIFARNAKKNYLLVRYVCVR